MRRIAFIRAVAFICSIIGRVVGIPFWLLGKVLRGIGSLFSLWHQHSKKHRALRKERIAQKRQNRVKQRQLRKEQKRKLWLERKKVREQIRGKSVGNSVLAKTYRKLRWLGQKIYWGIHFLFLKVYWGGHWLAQKAYWVLRVLAQRAYWNLYYPKSRKLYQTLCRNPYIELFFIFLRGFLKRDTEKISCMKILGTWEYLKRHNAVDKYHVVEEGKKRPVCIPEYFEHGKQRIEYFQSPDIYLAELTNVSLIGGSNVVIADNVLLNDAVYYDKDCRIDIRYSAIKNVFNGIAVIEDQDLETQIERGINLVGAASFNYYHLIVEILSRLTFVDGYSAYRDYPILVDEVVLNIPQFRSALECINRRHRPVIQIDKGKKYLVKDLIFPSANAWMPTNVYKRELILTADFMISNTALSAIRKSFHVWQKQPAWRKIFISRKNTQAIRLENENEVKDLFAHHGFEIVYTEEMSFQQQIEYFGQVKCIIATSGSALTNIIFCQPKTLVGCIIPSDHRFYMYSTIAYILGLIPIFLDAKIIEKTAYTSADTFRLDSSYVKRYIETIQHYLN